MNGKSLWILLSAPEENINKTHWEHVEELEEKAKQTWQRNIKTSSTMTTSASDLFRSQIIDINKMKMVKEIKEKMAREKKIGTRYDSVFFSTINRSCYHLSQKARISLRLTQIHFAWREKWNKIKTFNRTSEI